MSSIFMGIGGGIVWATGFGARLYLASNRMLVTGHVFQDII